MQSIPPAIILKISGRVTSEMNLSFQANTLNFYGDIFRKKYYCSLRQAQFFDSKEIMLRGLKDLRNVCNLQLNFLRSPRNFLTLYCIDESFDVILSVISSLFRLNSCLLLS